MTQLPVSRLTVGFLALLTLVAGPLVVGAQSPPKAAVKKATPTEKPAAPKPTEKLAEPATAEAAARVLDLRTFPVMEGAQIGSLRTLGILMYEAKGTPKAAFDFQRQQLVKRGFKEMPGGYSDATTNTGRFTKDAFQVTVSSSEAIGDPKQAGWSSVSVVNDGNVDLSKLPVPPGVKPFYPEAYRAAYTTDAKVAEIAAACRKLLLAAGWEPYGDNGDEMQLFKRNAIQLQSWVSTTPAEGGKTLIEYSTELLSVDLPAPPGTKDPDYTDFQKTLRFDSPTDQTDAILAFYQERLPKLGWKATTEKPIVDDRSKSQFLVYRNAQKDVLSLDLDQFTGIVRVTLKHYTEAEIAAEERLAKEQAEKEKLAEAKRNMKIKVAVPLPAKAGNLEKGEANLFEFTLATGSGPAALEAFREHFRKEGWTEEEGAEFGKNTGDLDFKKDQFRLSFSYFDIGIGDAEIRVSASSNVVLEPTASKDKPAADAPKPVKKPNAPPIPGLPELPPGVELPDEVHEILKKALEQAGDKPAPRKQKREKRG